MPVTTATAKSSGSVTRPAERRERNRQQRDGAHEIGADHQRPAAVAVDDAAPEPREDGAGERQRDREEAEIERAGARR